jgi:F-type H+-transporting ATPase subunit delta
LTKGSIPRRYAKALILLAQEENLVSRLGEELEAIAHLMEELPELFNSLRNPSVPKDKRRQILEAVLDKSQPHPLIRKFLLLILERRRFEFLPDIALAYRALADEMEGKVRAKVTSARRLDPAQIESIKNTLQEKTKKTVVLEMADDPSLIAGLVAQVGNFLFDFSLRSQLQRVQKELMGR